MPSRPLRRSLVAGALALTLVAAACSDDTDDTPDITNPLDEGGTETTIGGTDTTIAGSDTTIGNTDTTESGDDSGTGGGSGSTTTNG